jgi:hypothetical protein
MRAGSGARGPAAAGEQQELRQRVEGAIAGDDLTTFFAWEFERPSA